MHLGEKPAHRVLVIEDSDAKFEAIKSCILEGCGECSITRAGTMIAAELAIMDGVWSLVVLDISMDIAPSQLSARSRGQANAGGLDVAQKMFLLGVEAPTVIVTAFESFSATNAVHGQAEILDFTDLEAQARSFLGGSLLGSLQYNAEGWKISMTEIAKKALLS